MTHIIFRKPLPRDLLDTFSRNDPEMLCHLIGEPAWQAAQDLGCEFHFHLGAWNIDDQTIDTAISITGPPRSITYWLIKYT